MPTEQDKLRITREIEALEAAPYRLDLPDIEIDISWYELPFSAQDALLDGLNWEGFSESEKYDITMRTMHGEDYEFLTADLQADYAERDAQAQIDELTRIDYVGFTEWKDDRLLMEWYKAEDHHDSMDGMSRRSWPELDEREQRAILDGVFVNWSGVDDSRKAGMIDDTIGKFRPPDIEQVSDQIEWLKSMSYTVIDDGVPQPCSDCFEPWWECLTAEMQTAVVDANIDWRGVSGDDRERLIQEATAQSAQGFEAEWTELDAQFAEWRQDMEARPHHDRSVDYADREDYLGQILNDVRFQQELGDYDRMIRQSIAETPDRSIER